MEDNALLGDSGGAAGRGFPGGGGSALLDVEERGDTKGARAALKDPLGETRGWPNEPRGDTSGWPSEPRGDRAGCPSDARGETIGPGEPVS